MVFQVWTVDQVKLVKRVQRETKDETELMVPEDNPVPLELLVMPELLVSLVSVEVRVTQVSQDPMVMMVSTEPLAILDQKETPVHPVPEVLKDQMEKLKLKFFLTR